MYKSKFKNRWNEVLQVRQERRPVWSERTYRCLRTRFWKRPSYPTPAPWLAGLYPARQSPATPLVRDQSEAVVWARFWSVTQDQSTDIPSGLPWFWLFCKSFFSLLSCAIISNKRTCSKTIYRNFSALQVNFRICSGIKEDLKIKFYIKEPLKKS